MRARVIQPLALLSALALLALTGAAASARTIELQAEHIDKAAVISASAPRASWAGWRRWTNVYVVSARVQPETSLLVHYDLSEIPEDMRITKADWLIPVVEREPREARLSIWRMLTPWGAGVCHDYRMTDPEKDAWDKPGGRSPGVDRAVQPTKVVHVEEEETVTVNVTEDVSLWHRGLVPNEGWMLTVDDHGSFVRMSSPMGRNNWTLRITYEPQ